MRETLQSGRHERSLPVLWSPGKFTIWKIHYAVLEIVVCAQNTSCQRIWPFVHQLACIDYCMRVQIKPCSSEMMCGLFDQQWNGWIVGGWQSSLVSTYKNLRNHFSGCFLLRINFWNNLFSYAVTWGLNASNCRVVAQVMTVFVVGLAATS